MSESRGSHLIPLVLAALASPAAAQSTDYATCDTAALTTACSTSVASCCKTPFTATANGNAILIPMDRCHQPGSGAPGSGAPLNGAGGFNAGQGWCMDVPGSAGRIGGGSDDGMFRAYGLVYRLMQRGIPVYWLVNPTKTVPALTGTANYLATDVDLWVLGAGVAAPPVSIVGLTDCLTTLGCTQPVHHLDGTTLAPALDSYQKKEFPVRGSAFVIAPDDRPAFNAFWQRTGAYASLASQTKYDWTSSGIELYEVDPSAQLVFQNFNSGAGTGASPYALVQGAPVAVKVDYAPPRIARVGQTNAVATQWLALAGLDDPATATSCPSGEFVPSDATYCNVSDTQIQAGVLVSGGFEWSWIDDYDYGGTACSNPAQQAMFDKLSDFMTAIPGFRNAGNSIYLSRSINISESCANKQILGLRGTGGLSPFTGSPPGEPIILRYPTNLLAQWGDYPPSFASGGVSSWKYATNSATVGYNTLYTSGSNTLRRLASADANASGSNPQCTNHVSTATCDKFTPGATTGDIEDMAAYARFNNLVFNGIALYLGGNQLKNSTTAMRIVLSSLIALPDETITTSPTNTEISRSTPIVATDPNTTLTSVYQGTYVNQNPPPSITKATTSSTLTRFKYPYLTGHFRQIPIAEYQTTRRTFTTIASAATFDAADQIPTVNAAGCTTKYNGSCRTVFTTVAGGRLPDAVDMTTGNVAQLGPIMAANLSTAEQQTLISRILAGTPDGSGGYIAKLGGVDRSTVAVINESPIAGGSRPTMAYFGATDGMMHAVCVTTGNGCDRVGRELWAYIPRKLLSELRYNLARIDGSPRVIDAFGDFYNVGTKSWKTVLVFQMGSGSMNALSTTPAVYAIDVTKPNAPRVLWEYSVTSVSSRGTYELGLGLTLSAGPVDIAGTTKNVVFTETNNGGTGGAAAVVTALNLEDGSKLWQQGFLYPSPRTSSYEPVPLSGVPGGAVGIDKIGAGKFTDVVFGTLYGDVWQLDASNGTPRHGATTPLFRASTDYHPIGVAPAIYSKGGTQYAAFTTGGYYDSSPTLWNGRNLATLPTEFAFSVSMSKATTGSVDENAGAPNVPFKQNFATTAEAGFAQVMVVGNELFVTTDNSNVNLFDYANSGANSGKVYRFDFSTGSATTTPVVIAGGASSLGANGTTILSGTGQQGERLSLNATSSTGTSVSPYATATTSLVRKMWLRTE